METGCKSKYLIMVFSLIVICFVVLSVAKGVQARPLMQDGFVLESEHFIWNAGTSYLVGNISPENFAIFLSLIDEAYIMMYELVGEKPFGGAKIPIESTTEHWGAATWDGRILWSSRTIPEAMRNKEANNIAETRLTG